MEREKLRICKIKDGYGFALELRNWDLEPSHLHMLDENDNEITRILITDEIPLSKDDIKIYPNDPDISDDLKEKIVKWASSSTDDWDIEIWHYLTWIADRYMKDREEYDIK